MPRVARQLQQGYCCHLLNRGNGRANLFLDRYDYSAFVKLLAGMRAGYEVRLLAYCLMPNHFHLVLQAEATGAVSEAALAVVQQPMARQTQRFARRKPGGLG